MSVKYQAIGQEFAVAFLGAGHGGNDSGANGYLREETVNLKSALYCKDYLIENGITVYMSRNRDENDPLTEEIKECNACNCDCAVDMHANAGGGDGFEVFRSVLSSAMGGKLLAELIEDEVIKIGQNSRGVKTRKNSSGSDYYGFIRQTKVPAVITEACFVDNKKDIKDFDTNAELKEYGIAVAKGIIKWLEKTGKIEEPEKKKPAKKEPVKKEEPKVAYYKKCNSKENSLVDGLKEVGEKSNFATRKKIANANGVKSYTGTATQNTKLLELLKKGKLKKW